MNFALSLTRRDTKSGWASDRQRDTTSVVELHRTQNPESHVARGAHRVLGRSLRQRKVVEWMLAYLGASFILLEATDILSAIWGWSLITQKILCMVIALGFLPMLVLAWYHGAKGPQRPTLVEILILAVLLLGSGGVLWHASVAEWGESPGAGGDASNAAQAPATVAECVELQAS